jgi:hypothetical protein
MKTTFLNPNRRQGMTYMTVVITMIVVGVMLAAYLKLVSVQGNLAARSQNWNRGIPIVEAAVEEAMAHLNANGMPEANGLVTVANLSRSADGWSADSATGPWHKEGYIDGDKYYVIIDRWDGTTTNFPDIMAASYVQQNQAYAHNWNWNSGSAFLAVITPNMFPTNGASGTSRRLVSCGLTNIPMFTKALVAKHGIDMNGNGVYTDSYDSRIAGRNVNGRWDMSIRRDHGDIASNDTVTNAINVQNANIWGRVATGPLGTINVGSQGKVGDAAWQSVGPSGSIKPGWSTDDMNVEFADVVLPNPAGGWNGWPGGGTVNGVSYGTVFNAPGYYKKTSGSVGGKICINAQNVVIQVDTGWSFNGQDQMTISSNANCAIYLNCASADMQGQGIVNGQGRPDQCYIYGTSLLRSFDAGGNGETTAVVYAPYADVTMHGGGSSDQDFSGAIMANSFRFVGHYTIHYDEALARVGTWKGFTITSWNER